MPKTVICDTSVIFYLHRLRLLSLLRELYENIVIPQTVASELRQGLNEGEDVPDLAEYPWIQIKHIRIPKVIGLMTDLGPFLGRLDIGLLYPLFIVPIAIIGASNSFNMLPALAFFPSHDI